LPVQQRRNAPNAPSRSAERLHVILIGPARTPAFTTRRSTMFRYFAGLGVTTVLLAGVGLIAA